MNTILKISPRQILFITAYLAYNQQRQIQEDLNNIQIPEAIPQGKYYVSLDGEIWEQIYYNPHTQNTAYENDNYPGITILLGKYPRVEIDALVGVYRPLYQQKVVNLSDKVIEKMRRSGFLRKYPILFQLVPFEGNGKKGKKTSSTKKASQDDSVEIIGLEAVDD